MVVTALGGAIFGHVTVCVADDMQLYRHDKDHMQSILKREDDHILTAASVNCSGPVGERQRVCFRDLDGQRKCTRSNYDLRMAARIQVKNGWSMWKGGERPLSPFHIRHGEFLTGLMAWFAACWVSPCKDWRSSRWRAEAWLPEVAPSLATRGA